MFGKTKRLEQQVSNLTERVKSLEGKLCALHKSFWGMKDSDWLNYLESKTEREFHDAYDECCKCIDDEIPETDACSWFRYMGGPSTYTYSKFWVTVEQLLNYDTYGTSYQFRAVYNNGDLPADVSKELFMKARAAYLLKKATTKIKKGKKKK